MSFKSDLIAVSCSSILSHIALLTPFNSVLTSSKSSLIDSFRALSL
ncbi:hypothetical protein GBAR_LOCUS29387, partial [Geodia barretti]